MTFLALMLALLIGRFIPLPQVLERHEGFFLWRAKVAAWLQQQPVPSAGQRVIHWAGSVLLPVMVVALVAHVLQGVSWLLGLLFTTAILVLVFGATHGLDRIKVYVQAADTKDWPKAFGKVAEIDTTKQPLHSLAHGDWQGLHKAAICAFSYRALTQAFAPAFWLMLIGPAGALAYRWTSLFATSAPANLSSPHVERDASGQPPQDLWTSLSAGVERIVPFLDWLPVRALGLSFAITGNFNGSVMRWQQNLLHFGQTSAEFLTLVIDGSLRMAPAYERDIHSSLAEVKELHPLLQRTLGLWVTAIAIMVLFT